jgi:acetyl esterase/lipase
MKRFLPFFLMLLSRCAPVDLLNASVPTIGLSVTRDVAFGPRPDQRLDIYRPRAAAGLPTVLFIYGGGWHSGNRGMYQFAAASLARAGMVVVVPDYRLYPAVVFPDFLRDCAAAAAWVQTRQTSLGGGGGFFLMGHSAGAYNAVMLGLDPRWLRDAGGDPAQVSGVIGLAGPYDFTPTPDVAGSFPDAGPQTQPVNFARQDAPPLLLLAGADDSVVKPRNSLALAARARSAGGQAEVKIMPGLGHVGVVTALAPLFRWRAPVLRDVVAFIRAHASHPSAAVAKPAAHAPSESTAVAVHAVRGQENEAP